MVSVLSFVHFIPSQMDSLLTDIMVRWHEPVNATVPFSLYKQRSSLRIMAFRFLNLYIFFYIACYQLPCVLAQKRLSFLFYLHTLCGFRLLSKIHIHFF